jgi:coproporphyrinogen III oxidase-like Fe-S oxidoreductase
VRGVPARMRPADVAASFDGPAGAYLHIPFCEWICPFCPYNKVLARRGLAQGYFEALAHEVDAYLTVFPDAFTSLYVGGGTPTLYPDLLAPLVRRIPVRGERAIEVLPLHGTVARLEQLRGLGFSAVSIGAQSFHDGVLRHLHRPHDATQARDAVANAIGRFDCVDVDLIVDVALEDPLSYPGAFLDDVRHCFDAGVDQVSTYPLMRFGYTPFGTARHNRRREHEILAQVTALAHRMGYERRSVWTFNRRGASSYSSITRRRFLGMGAGSSTFAGRDFYVNHFGVRSYIEAVDTGELPIARWLRLGAAGGAAYDAFWQAYAGSVSPRLLSDSYGAWASPLRPALSTLSKIGWMQRRNGDFTVTDKGFDRYHDLERWVTYHFIEPLWAQMLAEHAQEGSHVPWARTAHARQTWSWRLASRAMERSLHGSR